jgi:hypothetical protein
MDGKPNAAIHCISDGIWVRNTTRLAGFEIGSTNDAALAMNAQANRLGSGSAFERRTALNTAGVSTTAVASFDMRMVTAVPAK